MNFTKPAPNSLLTIGADAVWPSVTFQTDGSGPHTWQWKVAWDQFMVTGTATTSANVWDATSVLTNRGGTVTVTATAGVPAATISIRIKATHQAANDVAQYH